MNLWELAHLPLREGYAKCHLEDVMYLYQDCLLLMGWPKRRFAHLSWEIPHDGQSGHVQCDSRARY